MLAVPVTGPSARQTISIKNYEYIWQVANYWI